MSDCIIINNLKGKDVKDLISVRYVIPTDKSKPSIHDVLFYTKNNRLYSEAAHGGKLSIVNIDCEARNGVFFNIPSNELTAVNKALKAKSNVTIEINNTEGKVGFLIDDDRVDCDLMRATSFVSFNKLITSESRCKFTIERDIFLSTLKELVKIMSAKKETKVCTLNIVDNTLNIGLNGIEDSVRTLNCICDCALDISFNLKYLVDMVNSIKDKQIVLEFKGSNSPIFYMGENKKDMLHPIK